MQPRAISSKSLSRTSSTYTPHIIRNYNVFIYYFSYNISRFGIYPLTAYPLEPGPVRLTTYQPQSPTGSMDQSVPLDRSSAGPVDVEVRRIVNMMCNIKPRDDAQNDFMVGTGQWPCSLYNGKLYDKWLRMKK